jgi:hypothetical protein
VTAAQLNQQVRDNLNVLSTHAHSGAAGMGSATMSGLTLTSLGILTFADQSANPDAAGELQRNGNDILWYGSSVVNLSAADASAGTASLRTLGTTSVKAAAGNHTHTITEVGSSEAAGSASIGSDSGVDVTIATVSRSAANSANAIVIIGAYDSNLSNGNVLYKIFQSTTLVASETLTGTGGSAQVIHTQKNVFQPASTSSIAYKLTMSPANVAANNQTLYGTIRVIEVTIL